MSFPVESFKRCYFQLLSGVCVCVVQVHGHYDDFAHTSRNCVFSAVESGGKLFSTRSTTFPSAPLIEKHPQPLCTWLAKLEIEFGGSLDGLFLKDLGQALRNPREESYLFNHFKTKIGES